LRQIGFRIAHAHTSSFYISHVEAGGIGPARPFEFSADRRRHIWRPYKVLLPSSDFFSHNDPVSFRITDEAGALTLARAIEAADLTPK
ncbi:MAG TPA: hypothetical protein VKE96_22640, partial [Vicinamibacterales bacterium]|nr:hypothetical protein [Vicinamibacterales bacterium]